MKIRITEVRISDSPLYLTPILDLQFTQVGGGIMTLLPHPTSFKSNFRSLQLTQVGGALCHYDIISHTHVISKPKFQNFHPAFVTLVH